MTDGAPRTVRERVRAELTVEIKTIARRQLAREGAAALSVRAVARELGMVSSAVYRYFPSRDELLTALIVDAYEAVAAAAEQAERASARATVAGRWSAIARAIRSWARAHPHEYALIYGSPVPGYRAPAATIPASARVSLVFLRVLAEGAAAGEILAGEPMPIPRPVHADFALLREQLSSTEPDILEAPDLAAVSDQVLSRGFLVWTELFGLVSFELFGHLHNVIHDYDTFFDTQMRRAGRFLATGT
jgi:AcrR family transcriptional regulator